MNSNREFFLTASAILLFVCSAAHADTRHYEAQEAAIRALLGDSQGAEIILVAFGSDGSGRNIDPPAEFLKRLANLPKPVKPASAGDFNESVQNNRFSGFRDRATHKRAWLYSITIKVLSSTKIELVVISSGGDLSGGELTFAATLDPKGHWKVEGPKVSAIF